MPRPGITEQDAHIGGYILEAGRALVVAVNKVDAIDKDKREEVQTDLERKLQFLEFAAFQRVSARHGTGIKPLLGCVDVAFAGLDGQALHAQAHARAAGRGRAAAAAHVGALPPQDALRATREA
jgi:predicted GTPase